MDDLQKRLEEFRVFSANVQGDLDRLSRDQQALLRAILQRIEREQLARARAALAGSLA